MRMNRKYALHFPDGSCRQWITRNHCEPTFRIGEGVKFEGEALYRIIDVHTQVREMPENSAGTEVQVIIINVFLEREDTNETP